jgi:ATP-dependent DNA ligase
MAENYCQPVRMDLADWLIKNPTPVICERKFDGFRVFLFKSGGKIVLTTKHGRIYTQTSHPLLFQRLQPLLKESLPNQLILDGEYVAPDQLHLFDILRRNDEDTTKLPLFQRKELLHEILAKTGVREFDVETIQVNSYTEIMNALTDLMSKGAEGIVLKNPRSKYGERGSWLKLKRYDTIDCFVIKYERTGDMESTGIPHSWYVGVYNEAGQVVEMGKVGAYVKEVDPLKIKVGTVVEIQFQEVTEELKFRHPHILRIREDKSAKECTIDQIKGHSARRE